MVKFFYIILLLFLFIIYFLYEDIIVEYFKPNRVLSAYNNEDLGGIRIILREDKSFEYILVSFLGTEETIKGNFTIYDGTLRLNTNVDLLSKTYTINNSEIKYIDEFNHINSFKIYELNKTYFKDFLNNKLNKND